MAGGGGDVAGEGPCAANGQAMACLGPGGCARVDAREEERTGGGKGAGEGGGREGRGERGWGRKGRRVSVQEEARGEGVGEWGARAEGRTSQRVTCRPPPGFRVAVSAIFRPSLGFRRTLQRRPSREARGPPLEMSSRPPLRGSLWRERRRPERRSWRKPGGYPQGIRPTAICGDSRREPPFGGEPSWETARKPPLETRGDFGAGMPPSA